MNEYYRGHCIRLTRKRSWDAVIIQADTGTVFPTKATALLREGRHAAMARACELIDLYLDGRPLEPGEISDNFTSRISYVFTPIGDVTGQRVG